ncbi:DUF2130 domain-containing protein [Putridiphycobacter roseus]|uniref:DUF2130 domain-containing protein n=1 Tax=Putridiphycobacter roseus TaxID=2219161 RepID=A0A2W1ND50_9FLAO|nr:DUF2130 domain-containing protein [Putridiphycobacter roseus]PZE17335.1 DUF2130 domain-containing protein [Putridiphycobacter roseus]
MNNSKIECPNCAHVFSVEDTITKNIEDRLKKELQKKQQEITIEREKQQRVFEEKQALQLKKEAEFEIKRRQAQEEYKLKIEADRAQIRKELTESAEKEASEKNELKFKQLEEEALKKKAEIRALQEKELVFMRKENELKERQEQLELKIQKERLETERLVEEKVKKAEGEKFEMQKREFQKKMDDQQKLIDEMKRKAEQGSMQMQGEVQELAIEDDLKVQFPFDIIEEVSKGVRGADCIQTVRNRGGVACGKIIYESKRTKNFSNEWIEKLKDDMRLAGADVPVLITETLPKNQQSFEMVSGVWVCSFAEFKSLAMAIREGLIKVQQVSDSNENKGDKMQMLYSFLTGNEFRSQVQAIVEGFEMLKQDLDKEKKAMMNIWKKREKQIEKVMLNTTNMYGSIEGIAGAAVQPIQSLGLDEFLLDNSES